MKKIAFLGFSFLIAVSVIAEIRATSKPVGDDVSMEIDDTLIIMRDSTQIDTIFFFNGEPIPERLMRKVSEEPIE
ncbi:MAG: hypothetical protein MJZ48_04810 [Paludibacteraceae bacterium]|nr:hypothetical protein [Paludibacteraceae bacterium]